MNEYVCEMFVFCRTCIFVRALFVERLSTSIREARPDTLVDV